MRKVAVFFAKLLRGIAMILYIPGWIFWISGSMIDSPKDTIMVLKYYIKKGQEDAKLASKVSRDISAVRSGRDSLRTDN